MIVEHLAQAMGLGARHNLLVRVDGRPALASVLSSRYFAEETAAHFGCMSWGTWNTTRFTGAALGAAEGLDLLRRPAPA